MEGQFARMANLGDTDAQSFYGHILAFRGQGLGAKQEGVRLLRLAGLAGDGKAAYQVGAFSLAGSVNKAPDAAEAVRWWTMAAKAGHPLASIKLVELYQQGGPGLMPDSDLARRYQRDAN